MADPKRLSISPGAIAVHNETVYNKDARTRDFCKLAGLFLFARMGIIRHRASRDNYRVTTEEVSFFHAL